MLTRGELLRYILVGMTAKTWVRYRKGYWNRSVDSQETEMKIEMETSTKTNMSPKDVLDIAS